MDTGLDLERRTRRPRGRPCAGGLTGGLPASGRGWAGDSAGADRYVVGALRQTTASVDVRAGYTFSRALTLQLWAQPFASAGRYGALREVSDARAATFAARYRVLDAAARDRLALDDPDFGVRELRANAVARWEFRPGSALFLVWYAVYVLLADYAHGFMSTRLGDSNITVGLLFGLGQFVSTFAITMAYRSWANKKYDAQAETLRNRVEGGLA